ncbi:MAG: hypothetical protein PWP37_286, partial [Thermotogota bacterium]|nr:hypothetical protein [Thermotogota bacterium]
SCDHVRFVGEEGRKTYGSAIVCMSACFSAPQDCKSSTPEQEEVKRRYFVTSLWLGNYLHKFSIGVSQDLETEMCDEKKEKRFQGC